MRTGLGWFTLSQGHLSPPLLTGVTVASGTLAFSVQGTHVSGTIRGSGQSDVFEHVSTYEAQFTGKQHANAIRPQAMLLGVGQPPEVRLLRAREKEPERDVAALYPLGQLSTPVFTSAQWILDPDGGFAFIPETPQHWLIGGIQILGRYEPRGNTFEFHGSFHSSRDGTLTLDGFLHPVSDGFQIHALYSVSIRGVQQVEQVTQRLVPQPDGTIPDEVAQRLHAIATATGGRPARLVSEPSAVVQGIPVPSIYRITLSGRTEAGEFVPFSGKLLVYPSTPSADNPLSVTLALDGPVRNGWLMWQSEQSGFGTTEPVVNSRVRLENGRIEATVLREGLVTRQLTWYTRHEKSPGAETNIPVYAESGTLQLKIQHDRDDRVVGTVSATGTSLGDTPQPSSYTADLTGEREGSSLLAAVTETVGARRFSGRWKDAALGVIDLRQMGASVTGSSAGGAITVTGSVQDDWLAFTWHSAREGQGRGFLRALPGGGTLVGLRESGSETATFPAIVAVQQETQQETSRELVRIPRNPTPGEIQELKYLGYDLAAQGKCQQAVQMLETVVHYYKQQAVAAATPPMAREEFLVSQGLPLIQLVNCYVTLGDYKNFLDRLEDVLALDEMLEPEQLWVMRFQHHASELTRVLSHNIELFTTITAGTKALLEQAHGGGIGVVLSPEQHREGVLLAAVTEGMPAAAAGLQTGDALVRIDGQFIAGMTRDEAVKLLRGKAGAEVKLVVRRAGRDLDYTLVRAPLLTLSAPYRDQILNGVAQLVERAAAWHTSLTAALDATEELHRRLREQKPGVRSAFKELQALSARAHDDMATAVAEAVELGHAMLRAAPVLHGYYATAVTYLRVAAAGQLVSKEQVSEAQDFAAKVRQFLEQDRETSWLEQEIYKRQIALLEMLYPLSYELKVHAAAIDRMDIERNYEEAAAHVRTGLEHLPTWIEQWRARLVTDAAKIQALEESQAFFRRYVRLLATWGESSAALVASEAARARAFLDLLAGRSPTGPRVSDSLSPTTDVISLATTPPLALADIQETVKTGETTAVEYFILDDQILIWLISPTGAIQMRSAPVARGTLEQDIARFVALVERPPEPDLQKERAVRGQAQAELWPLLERFYALLIVPIKDLLPQSPKDVVTIIPHLSLFRIPFAALKQEGQDRFLVEEQTLVYAPSIGVLRHIQQRKREASPQRRPTLLALVNPTFGADAVDSQSNPFTPLPDTEQNFGKIVRYYTGENRILAGSAATKEAFLAEAHAYDVIYFATHAEAIETDPSGSYIALAGDRLRVPEVAAARLQADLVILGACQTGRGRVTGDGVEGLSRQFMWAGTPTLLATLWKVFEHQTLDQSLRFHEHWLGQGHSKAAALREAQLQGRTNFPKQIEAWAGFILVGTWR